MKQWNIRTAILLAIMLAAEMQRSPARHPTPPVSFAKLGKLAPEQRQKTLVEKAKAEGEVSFYSSLQAQQIDPFIQLFRKRYPFIKVNPYRVSGNRQVIKIQTEMNAGNHLFDVTNGSSEQASALRKIGAIDPYDSPQRDFFVAPNKDKEGYFTSLYVIPIVLGYNTNLVKRAEAPKSYEDLLQPKWKSNMFLDDEAYEWFAVLLKSLGTRKGTAIHEKSRQAGFAHGARPDRAEPTAGGRRTPFGDRIIRPYRARSQSPRRAARSGDPRSLPGAGQQADDRAPCASPSRGRAVHRLVAVGRRTER